MFGHQLSSAYLHGIQLLESVCAHFRICNKLNYPIKQFEHVNSLSALNTFGNHCERKQDDRCSGDANRWIATRIVIYHDPFHTKFLCKSVAKRYSKTLKFERFMRLDPSGIQNTLQKSQFFI